MKLLFVLALLASSTASIWESISTEIAVVEFEYVYEGDEIIQKNIQKYQQVLANLTQRSNLDMIIFPELSLKVMPETSPEINLKDNPCNQQDNYPDFIVTLSCESNNLNIYLVTNLVEKVKCNPTATTSDNCKNTGYYYYNTNLIFDRNGTIAHRYRKFNLFGEFHLDKPDKPEVVIFETDFGVKFATFTCFDILFQNPAQDIVAEDIDGIIYPTNWHSQLPFLTAIQVQQMFAYTYDVVLFAAGGSKPLEATGGSGVYRGSKDMILNTFVATGGTETLLFSSSNGMVAVSDSKSDDDLAKKMDAFPLWIDDSLELYEFLPVNTSAQVINEQLCSTNETTLCCDFTIKLTTEQTVGDSYSYLMVAYSGYRHYTNISDGIIEVCGIIACLNSSILSCGQRFPNYDNVKWPISFTEITIEANYEINGNKTQFPNSLKSSIRPIEASETQWTSQTVTVDGKDMIRRKFSTTTTQNRLLTFAIYGRDFTYDTFPRDNYDGSNGGNHAGSLTQNFILLTVFCVITFVIM